VEYFSTSVSVHYVVLWRFTNLILTLTFNCHSWVDRISTSENGRKQRSKESSSSDVYHKAV